MPSGHEAIAAPTAASTDSGFAARSSSKRAQAGGPVAVVEELLGLSQGLGFPVAPRQQSQLERRRRALGLGRRGSRSPLALEHGDPDDDCRGGCRSEADQDAGAARRHAASLASGPCKTPQARSYTS